MAARGDRRQHVVLGCRSDQVLGPARYCEDVLRGDLRAIDHPATVGCFTRGKDAPVGLAALACSCRHGSVVGSTRSNCAHSTGPSRCGRGLFLASRDRSFLAKGCALALP